MKKTLLVSLLLILSLGVWAQSVTYKITNKNTRKNPKAVNSLVKTLPGQSLGSLDSNSYEHAYIVIDKKDSVLKNYKGDITVMLRKQKNFFVGLDYIALNEHSLIGLKFGYINELLFVDVTGGWGKITRDSYILESYTYGADFGFRVYRKLYLGTGLQYYYISAKTNNNYKFDTDILAIPLDFILADDRFGVFLSLALPINQGPNLVSEYSVAKIGAILKF